MINGFIFFFNNLNHSQPTSPNETLLPGVKAMRLAASPWVDMVFCESNIHGFPRLSLVRRTSAELHLGAVCRVCHVCHVCRVSWLQMKT
jgi:hypothetical protein